MKLRCIRKTFVLLLFGALVFCGFIVFHGVETCSAAGTTLHVGGSGGGNFTSIQEAINASSPGDEVYVHSGTYYENIVITVTHENIILTGQNKDNTIIDGDKKGHVIHVQGFSGNEIQCSISGFTVRNAGGTGNDCIAMSYVSSGNINDNKILNSDQSSGVQLDHCNDVTINDNTISNNDNWYGIHLITSTNNNIYNNVVRDNSKGIYIDESSNNHIYNNDITGNRNGIYILSSSSNNYFYLNDFTNDDKNAQDYGTNSWSYNEQGNKWDDYDGVDENPEDGIGDTPYSKYGAYDPYPLGYFQTGNQKPIATILSISPTTASYGEPVSFRGMGDDPDGDIVAYSWRSSINGPLNTGAMFSTTSLSSGTHTIYFKVRDNDDEWSEEKTRTIIIESPPNQKPIAHISSINPKQTTYGNKVYFSGYGVDPDEDDSITGYKWSSSTDGVISTQQYFNKSDLSVGTHLISFQVKDNHDEWSDKDFDTVIISSGSSSSNNPPVADASGPYTGYVSTSINFNASNSYDTDGDSLTFSWDFGDGTTGTGETIEHTYEATGKYTVNLTVTDSHGYTDLYSTYASIAQSTSPNGNNGDNDGTTGSLFDNIPIVVLAPVVAIIVFLTVIALFFFSLKRT